MRELLEEMFSSLFSSESDNTLEFVTWTGEDDSFIIKKGTKEYRVSVSEEKEGGIHERLKTYGIF